MFCLLRTNLDGNSVVTHINIARIHENVLARVRVETVGVANFSWCQKCEVGHENVVRPHRMHKPIGTVPCRKSIENYVCGIVKLNKPGSRQSIRKCLVVWIELATIGLGDIE